VTELGASRLAELWTRRVAGETLSDDESAHLTEAFLTEEVFRRRVLNDRQVDGALRALGELRRRQPEMLVEMEELLEAAAHSDGFVERLRPRLAAERWQRQASSRWVVIAGLGLAVGAAALVGLRRGTPPSPPGRQPVVAARTTTARPADRAVPRSEVRRAVLLLGADDPDFPPSPRRLTADERLRARLDQLGFSVEVLTADDPGSPLMEALARAQVVVLSSSLSMAALNQELVSLAVPLVALESSAFARLGLTGTTWRRDLGNTGQLREVLITDPGHPLAAGLTGEATVLVRRQRLRWGLPGEDAIVVAGYPGVPHGESAVFGYERGSRMPGGIAPARRVALFLGNGRVVSSLTADGWKLFDAAVSWSAADRR
jgi:hypothetical protein